MDDHEFLADGLRARLALTDDLEFAGYLPTAQGLLAKVKETGADIVLLDIEMPGPDPFEAIGDLRRRSPESRVLVLSAYVRDHYFESAVEAGAWGYLSKGDNPECLVEAIRKAARGEFAFSPEVEERCWIPRRPGASARASRLSGLTNREQQVLRLIGRGMSRADIARVLHRSPKTVDAHQSAIMNKLDIHDRVDLVRYAIRERLVEP
ncbi:MAG: LuxR C-terminal-related transcriptional regulator [Planctomycetota bacterium]